MKRTILKLIFDKYRNYFFAFFVEEMVGSIPEHVQEPAMQFLANGREKMTKWILYWVNILQQRITTDKREIEVQQGMILMLKIFLNLVLKQPKPRQREVPAKVEPKPDYVAEVDAAIKAIKEKSPEQ